MSGAPAGRPATRAAPATKTPPGAGPSRRRRPRASRDGRDRSVTSERGNFVGTSLEATSMVPIKRSIDAQREKKARGIKSSTNDTVLRFTRTHPTAVRPDACYSRPKRRAAALESPTRTAPVSSRQRPSPRPSAEPSARRTLLLRISVSRSDGDSESPRGTNSSRAGRVIRRVLSVTSSANQSLHP
jgi:hypothetical protein